MEPVSEEQLSWEEGKCPHGTGYNSCRTGSTLFKFYKDGEMEVEVCIYKKWKDLDVSMFDKMEAYPQGYPIVLRTEGRRVYLKQGHAVTKYTFDISKIDVIDLYNDMLVTRECASSDDDFRSLSEGDSCGEEQ